MSTYNEIFGGKVNVLASDPSNPVEGQMWFNTTSQVLKYRIGLVPAAWSTGGNLAAARFEPGGAGTQTSALAFGGSTTGVTAATEEYDGTSWTGGPNLATARRELGGAGTQTAGLAFAGETTVVSAATEEYTGSINTTKTVTPV